MGWFFGFKLHLVFNNDNEIVALKLTPGNVHDTTPVPALTRELTGKLFGDKGYIGRELAEDLLRLTLFTRIRKNMKSLPISLQDWSFEFWRTWLTVSEGPPDLADWIRMTERLDLTLLPRYPLSVQATRRAPISV